MAICRHWNRGHCKLGNECGFHHPTEEVRKYPCVAWLAVDDALENLCSNLTQKQQQPFSATGMRGTMPDQLPAHQTNWQGVQIRGHAERMKRVSTRIASDEWTGRMVLLTDVEAGSGECSSSIAASTTARNETTIRC